MASLLLGDLNDYIEPSQACILPPSEKKQDAGSDKNAEQPVTITLADCLACSGCVTSAETILVAQQTYNKLLDALSSGSYKRTCVSLSSQTVASLAAKFHLSADSTWRRLNYFLKTILGVHDVLDISVARSITLTFLAEEFIEWYEKGKNSSDGPLIVSACPGWVCFAEKRYPDFLPLLSRTRSPQQIAGVLTKHYYNGAYGASEIFHCSVMPCFDKKLEASRDEFLADLISNSREVDTVITTTELLQILTERLPDGTSLSSLPEDTECNEFFRHEGTGSGGYLDFVLNYSKDRLFPGVSTRIERISGRNSDNVEFQLKDQSSGRKLLSFVALSGFRNIQNFVLKQRKSEGKTPIDFAEIMACPSGCLNGGGQIKAQDTSRSAGKEWLGQVNKAFDDSTIIGTDRVSGIVGRFRSWLHEDYDSRQKYLLATYKKVAENEKIKTFINVQW